MKKLFSILFVILSVCKIFADDGGSYYPEEWTYGNIYVKEPNQKIALENEILQFEPRKATAIFDFKNTTNETVKVPCSFPIVTKIPFCFENNKIVVKTHQSDTPDSVWWEIALNRYIKDPKTDEEWLWYDSIPLDELLSKDKTLRVEKYSDYLKQLESLKVVDFYSDENHRYGDKIKKAYSGCTILLDGKEIPIQNVGIEVTIDFNPNSKATKTEYGYKFDGYSYLTVVLHFYHELEFKPSKHSKLEVSYEVVSERSSYHGTSYEGFYDISTGGTWKGNMKNFLVVTDMSMKINNGDKTPKRFQESGISNCYFFEDYKPNKNEYFVFTGGHDGEDADRLLNSSDFFKQDFVKDIKASSYLKGTYQYERIIDPSGSEIATSDYSPKTSFDCDPYNGWVEGVKGDGIGEWISFTLTKKVFGPFAINGLTRFGYFYDEKFGYGSQFYGKGKMDSWLENNRIKKMKLSSSNGIVATLDFEDYYAGFPSGWDSLNINHYNTIKNPQFLEPGTYKMQIEEVYKGSKYDDTVLGEVWFIEFSDDFSKFLDKIQKLESPILFDSLKKIIQSKTVDFKNAEWWTKERLKEKE